MKTYLTRTGAGIDSLELADIPMPGPLAAGQIRIAMRAASLNYRDTMIVSGQLGLPGPEGQIVLSDGSGEVIEVAPDVTRIKVGDHVALTVYPLWIGGGWQSYVSAKSRGHNMPGVMAEELVVHESEAVFMPAHLSFEESAALPCAGVTAWHALCGPAPLYPGSTVLLQGAGGVSVLALQFAKLFGARVIMTSSSTERGERLKALGADEVINYSENADWHLRVRELTDGAGVDLSVDVGGAATVDRCIAATRRGGRVALVGLLTGWPESVSSMFSSAVDITPIKVGSREDFERMTKAIDYHKLHPVIDRSYDFDSLPEAMRYLESGKQFGKIVITFN